MLATKEPLKRYTIRHQGMEIVIETETTKNNSILALLRLLAREVKKTRPGDWKEFVNRVNQADRLSETNALDKAEDDFDFFERLMQQT